MKHYKVAKPELCFSIFMGKDTESLPYADSWDLLGALTETIRSWTKWGPVFVVIVFFLGVLAGISLDSPPYYIGSYVFSLSCILVCGYLGRVGYVYFRLFTFKCPRCHARWRGLLKKTLLCESCGLRIYQDS
jgi:hypothetical protein